MGRRVDGSIGTLLQGVSQQPVRQRLEGQVTEQVNMTSDVVRMLSRRPPTQFLQAVDVTGVDIENSFVHKMELSSGARYYVLVPPDVNSASDLIVLDADTGARITTLNVSSQFLSYINTSSPRSDLQMITIGDLTFVVDKTVDVAMQSDTDFSPTYVGAKRDAAWIDVEVGQYSRTYTVEIKFSGGSTFTFSYNTPDSTGGAIAEANIAPSYIAGRLRADIVASSGITSVFNVSAVHGSSFHLVPNVVGLDYNVTVSDGTGGAAMRVAVKNTAQTFNDLPPKATIGTVFKVTGGTGGSDDVYMRFKADADLVSSEPYSDGSWVETRAPTEKYKLDPNTMPHLIQFTGSGTNFDLGAAGEHNLPKWADREAGDDLTNTAPEFVGKGITNLTTFQDRLVFLTGEFVHMSVTSDFFNPWKKTVTTLLDDGPIGLSAVSDKVNNLRYASQHNKDMIVFADERQFTISGKTALTPKTATMTETTSFKIQSEVAPAPSGQNLFFAVDSGAFSGVREFYTDSTLDSDNARPITIPVERYISGKIRDMQSSTNLDKLVVLADSRTTLYVYEYLWDQDEKIQEAWSKWTFDPTVSIIAMTFNADNLDIVLHTGNELHFVTMELNTDPNVVIGGDIHLDRREALVAGTTAVSTNLPNDVSAIAAVQSTGCPNPGLAAEILDYDGTTITFKRDMQGGTVLVGVKYLSMVSPTMPLMRDASGMVIGTSKLSLGEMFINFENSGDFNVDVTADYDYTTRNPGRVLGEESATIGEYSLRRGTFPVPIRAETERTAMEIYSDSPYPFTIVDIEWEGQFYKRGQRVTRPR